MLSFSRPERERGVEIASVHTVIQPVTDLVTAHGFRVGLLIGSLPALMFIGIALARVHIGSRGVLSAREPEVAAAIVCVGGLVAMRIADVPVSRSSCLLFGLGALALVGLTGTRLPYPVRVIATLPGSALIAASLAAGFARTVAVVAIVIGTGAIADLAPWSSARSVGPVMLAVTTLGVYLCTPDTEHAVIVLGVALAVGLTGWPVRATAVGGAGGAAFVGLIAWLAATDGAARPGAVVGASACIGVFTFGPVLRRLGVSLDREWTASAGVGLAAHRGHASSRRRSLLTNCRAPTVGHRCPRSRGVRLHGCLRCASRALERPRVRAAHLNGSMNGQRSGNPWDVSCRGGRAPRIQPRFRSASATWRFGTGPANDADSPS